MKNKLVLGVSGALTASVGLLLATCTEMPSTAAPGGSVNDLLHRRGAVLPAAATAAMKPEEGVHQHPAEVRLWPGAAPGSETQTSAEIINWRTENDTITKEPFSFPTVTNIHFPSVTPYLPAKDKNTGAAVIIAPGGASQFLTINHEGYDLAKYFADHGVAAFVLKYRLVRAPTYPANTYNLTHVAADGVRAMRVVRAHAAEWGINPNAIGTMGFSAGGDVVSQVHLHSDDGNPNAADPIERVSSKPNFEAPIYTGSFGQIIPTKDSPPVFIMCSYDDSPGVSGSGSLAPSGVASAPAPAPAAPPATAGAGRGGRGGPGGPGGAGGGMGMINIYMHYKALNVPAELHIFSTGGHGFGGRDRPIEEAHWMDNFIGWLGDRGLTKK